MQEGLTDEQVNDLKGLVSELDSDQLLSIVDEIANYNSQQLLDAKQYWESIPEEEVFAIEPEATSIEPALIEDPSEAQTEELKVD